MSNKVSFTFDKPYKEGETCSPAEYEERIKRYQITIIDNQAHIDKLEGAVAPMRVKLSNMQMRLEKLSEVLLDNYDELSEAEQKVVDLYAEE